MTSETPELTYTLIRRVLTALIHHVKKADQFTPLADLLVGKFASLSKSTQSTSPEHIESLRRMLEIISVPTAVRQGSRLARKSPSSENKNWYQLQILPSRIPSECIICRNKQPPHRPCLASCPSQICEPNLHCVRNATLGWPRAQIPPTRMGSSY